MKLGSQNVRTELNIITKVDTNNDNIDDLAITLTSIGEDGLEFTITKINAARTASTGLFTLTNAGSPAVLALFFIFLVLGIVGYSVKTGHMKSPLVKLKLLKKEENKEQAIGIQVTEKMEAIMSAMHPREKEILQSIVEQNGKTTQARVYHATGIPTTSLSRWMDSLERKGLVESKRLGKLRRVYLTEKFLGKKKKA